MSLLGSPLASRGGRGRRLREFEAPLGLGLDDLVTYVVLANGAPNRLAQSRSAIVRARLVAPRITYSAPAALRARSCPAL